ncbi:MAG TPA: alpha/beta hydrolase [Candidatus Eisenbacteria bacterium]|nr:alpha/beta hydrolase [Candidatus Eisenbacteria bacterium]
MRYVHRYVPAPGGQLEPRTLLLLHGTGGNELDLLPLGPMLDPYAALLSPRGDVLENGMPRFFRRIREGVFDEEDVKLRARALSEFVAEARAEYGLGQVTAAGFSNGANIASAVMLLHPATLAGGVLLAPMVPIEPDPLPDLTGTPVFLGAGRSDPLVSVTEAERLAALLTRAGADVTLHWHPGGHSIDRGVVTAAHDWLAARVG